MKEINLSDLLQYNLAIYGRVVKCKDEDYQIIIDSMKEACRQTLKNVLICLENKETFTKFELQQLLKQYGEKL